MRYCFLLICFSSFIPQQQSAYVQYGYSLYWALGLMSGTADGNLPVTTLQSVYNMSLMVLGVFLFAYVTSQFTQLVDSISEEVKQTMADTARVATFFKKHSLAKETTKRILDCKWVTCSDRFYPLIVRLLGSECQESIRVYLVPLLLQEKLYVICRLRIHG